MKIQDGREREKKGAWVAGLDLQQNDQEGKQAGKKKAGGKGPELQPSSSFPSLDAAAPGSGES